MLDAFEAADRRQIRMFGLLAGACVLALTTGPAFAQSNAAATQEGAAAPQNAGEIVVTATRRAQSLKDTPVAVAAITGETLARQNISSFQSLSRIEPALVVNNQGAAGNQFIIRGILSDIGSTTGFYVDDAPLVGGHDVESNGDGKPGLRLYDIDRVEVLKGPQGTLFGEGSMAGTLRVITNKPKLDKVEAGLTVSDASVDGGNALQMVNGYLNLPLTSKIAIRAVGWGEFGGGYIDQRPGLDHTLLLNNVNDRTVGGGRIEVLIKPTDDFSLIASATHQQIKVDGVQSYTLASGPYLSTLPTQEPYHDNYSLYSLTGEYDAGFGTFTAIGSYGRQLVTHPEDSTPTGQTLAGISTGVFCAGGVPAFPGLTCPITSPPISFTDTQVFKDYTGEGRFASKFGGPFQLVAGGFYERDRSFGTATAVAADPVTGIAECPTLAACTADGLRKNVVYAQSHLQHIDQWALYAQGDYKIFDNLTATAGIRYYHARILDITTQQQDIVTGFAGIVDTPVPGTPDRATEHSPSYNFALLYKATKDVSFYARAASGFRIGGTNDAAGIAANAGIAVPAAYKPDKLWSYEAGVKANLLNRKLYVELTAYQMNWNNLQVSASDSSGAFNYNTNASKARIRGAEFQANYHVGGLTIGGGATYTDATLRKDMPASVETGGTFGNKGDRLPRIPHWIVSGLGEYDVPVRASQAYLQGNFSFRGSSRYSFNEENAFDEKLPSYFIVGAALGVRLSRMDISLYGENLTNKVAYGGLNAQSDGVRVYPVDPRTVGVRVQLHY